MLLKRKGEMNPSISFPVEMREKSIANYADYYELNVENVSIHDVFTSSAGIKGWAENYGN